MGQIVVYADEDVNSIVMKSLKLRGYKVLSTLECGNSGEKDRQQLSYAKSIQAVLLTCNVRDFARLHHQLAKTGESHCGIIVSSQLNPKIIAKRLLNLLNNLLVEDMINRLEYLSNWD